MQNSITIPSEVSDAYFADDAAILIINPPIGIHPKDWLQWAENSIVLPVIDAQPITEGGRTLCRIAIGDVSTNEGDPPQEFRLSPSAPVPTVSINLGPSDSPRRYTPSVTTTGVLPHTHAPAVDLPRATKPVRVHPATHRKLKAYAAQTGQEIAVIIGAAVDKYLA